MRKQSTPAPEPTTTLVIGARGLQGSALARHLLARGHRVRAFTRSPASERALDLAAAGAAIVQGNLDDPESLERSVKGVDAMFIMGTPFEAGPQAETRQGIAAVDAAAAADVPHVVYNSVANADRATGIPHFESKHQVELHLAASGLDHTIVAPVGFMENFIAPWSLPALAQGVVAHPIPGHRPQPVIAVRDLAAVDALVLENPDRFAGARLEIAGDVRTADESVAILSKSAGRPIRYVRQSIDEVRGQGSDLVRMYEWLVAKGYDVDLPASRRRLPEIRWTDFGTWAAEQTWGRLLGTA